MRIADSQAKAVILRRSRQLEAQCSQQVHALLHAAIAVQRLHGRDILRTGQRLPDGDGAHVVLLVISGSLHPIRAAVEGRHIRQHRAGPCSVTEGHEVHKGLECGACRARRDGTIQRAAALTFRAGGGQRHQNLARAVIRHHHGRLGNIAALQALHFLAGNGGAAALQSGIQRKLPGHPARRRGGIDTAGLHAQRGGHFLPQPQQNQVAALESSLRMPHGVELRGRFHQRHQQGSFRRGQFPCPLAEIKASGSLGAAAHIAEIRPVQIGAQQFLLAVGHFQPTGLQHLAQLGAQIPRRGRAVHLGHLHADGAGAGFPLPAELLPGSTQQGQRIHPAVGIKALVLRRQQGAHQLRRQFLQRLAAVAILPRHIAQQGTVAVEHTGIPRRRELRQRHAERQQPVHRRSGAQQPPCGSQHFETQLHRGATSNCCGMLRPCVCGRYMSSTLAPGAVTRPLRTTRAT